MAPLQGIRIHAELPQPVRTPKDTTLLPHFAISVSQELLKSRLTQPRYLESHAPKVIEKAVTHGYVTSCDPSRNRSYADFTADLAQWK